MFEKMAYELPRMSKCCCCLGLRTGSLVIAYVSIGIASSLFAAVTWSLVKVVNFVNTQNNNETQEHTREEINQVALGVYISHAYFLMVLLYYFVISVLLLIGLFTNKTKYMRYYFKSGLFLLAMALALVVVTTIFFGLMATIPLLKWSLMLFYFLVVVRSTYLEMEEKNKPRVYEMQLLQLSVLPSSCLITVTNFNDTDLTIMRRIEVAVLNGRRTVLRDLVFLQVMFFMASHFFS